MAFVGGFEPIEFYEGLDPLPQLVVLLNGEIGQFLIRILIFLQNF